MHARRISLGFASAVVLCAAAGCSEQRLLQERADFRRQSFAWTADGLAKREQRSIPHLEDDVRYVDERLKHDAQKTGEDLVTIDRYIHQDVERFIDRLPAYKQEVERQLRGKPENLERTAILIFY